MKIKQVYNDFDKKYIWKIKIIKKWIFWIILEQEAYFVNKTFHLKITKLDKDTIKVWFPNNSLDKWKNIFIQKWIAFILIEKIGENYEVIENNKWKNLKDIYSIDLLDYESTKKRVLQLFEIWIELNEQKNFLLEQKTEDLYYICLNFLVKIPFKSRYFIRQKIEDIFLLVLEKIYKYKYNLFDRKLLIISIFDNIIILKEFFRLSLIISNKSNDWFYLEIQERFIELLKICKTIKLKL